MLHDPTSEHARSQPIATDQDVVAARQLGRHIAEQLGFDRPERALIATAISELARNIVSYAGHGRIYLTPVMRRGVIGLRIDAHDSGPGIADLESAMIDGFSTANSLGLGLPGTRRIVDDFRISSSPGNGVKVMAIKWRTR